MSDTVTVIQADREAAAEHILEMGAPLLGLPDAIAKGEVDSHPIVQLLARHRIAHEPKWLPEMIERASNSEVSNALIGIEFRACALPTPPEQAE